MKGFNRAIIAGNLTRDPEVRYTVNKKAYARFTVAVNNQWKNANGELQDSTDYINVVAWGNNAEICGKYLKKGSPVLVEGRIKTGSYDARDGSGKRYTTEIWLDNMVMLSSRQSSSGLEAGGFNSQASDNFGTSISENGFDDKGFSHGFGDDDKDNNGMSDDDIPF